MRIDGNSLGMDSSAGKTGLHRSLAEAGPSRAGRGRLERRLPRQGHSSVSVVRGRGRASCPALGRSPRA